MAEVTKYQLIPNYTNFLDLKPNFSVFKLRKNSPLIYGIALIFVFFTIFLAFSPTSSPSDETYYRSHFSSVYSYFFPNSTQFDSSRSHNNVTFQLPPLNHSKPISQNLNKTQVISQNLNKTQISNGFDGKGGNFEQIMQNNSKPISQNLNNTQISNDFGDKVGNFDQIEQNNSKPISQNLNKTLISHDLGDKDGNFEQNNSKPISQNLNKTQISHDFVDKDGNFEQIEQNNSKPISQNLNKTQISHDFGDFSDNKQNNSQPISQNLNKTQISHDISDKVGNFEQIDPQPISQNPNKTQISPVITDKDANFQQNNAKSSDLDQVSVPNNATVTSELSKNSSIVDQPIQISPNSPEKDVAEVKSKDLAASLSKNKGINNQNQENLVENLVGCDLYDGNWVRDESYPLYKPGSCSLIDEQFNCFLNGRPDTDYQMLKWKPQGCTLPRLDGGKMLELLKGKRLVFVGDSLNRNMWESLVCILKNSVRDQKKVYEAFGHHNFRTEASYSFVFEEYNSTVEFFVSPFLVQQWEVNEKNGAVKETLRLDLMVSDADQFKNADYIIFNTGHWWTHDKTSKGEDYYQEGSHVYKQLDVTEAFRRAITTWGRWVDANINPQKTQVLFRGYSASHFSGGQWNSGGQCDSETDPIKNDTYLTEYPPKMKVFESVIKGMKTPVSYLNVTKLTDYRKDGHPSIYRKLHLTDDEKRTPLKYQDCSHWCLPGVPDSWNELLYAELLRKQYVDSQRKNRT